MPPLGTFGAPDPDRRRRFRRPKTPDVRPIAVRDALRRFRPKTPADPGERHRLERSIRDRLRSDP
jgi:hypothetical protein